MPGRDHSLALRKGLVELLRADAALIALGSPAIAARIYGERPPAAPEWPYVLVGTIIAAPYAPSSISGSDANLAVHCFARGPSADLAYEINAALWKALDEKRMTIGGADCLRIAVQSSQVIADVGSPTDWHGIVSISALTAEPAT